MLCLLLVRFRGKQMPGCLLLESVTSAAFENAVAGMQTHALINDQTEEKHGR